MKALSARVVDTANISSPLTTTSPLNEKSSDLVAALPHEIITLVPTAEFPSAAEKDKFGRPGEIRTRDQGIMSPLL